MGEIVVCPLFLRNRHFRAVPAPAKAGAGAGAGTQEYQGLLDATMRELNIPRDAIPRMADAALTITRLLDRNVRVVTRADAIDIYEKAY